MAKWETAISKDRMLLKCDGRTALEVYESHAAWAILCRIAALLNEAEPDGEIKKAADILFTTPGGHGYTVDTLWGLVAK